MVIRKLSISGIVLSSNRFTLAGVEVEGAAVVEGARVVPEEALVLTDAASSSTWFTRCGSLHSAARWPI